MGPAPRFMLDTAPRAGVAELRGNELHHLRDVMRLQAGACVILLGRDGKTWTGTIRSIERDCAIIDADAKVSALEQESVQRFPIIVAASIAKGPRMDFLVEKIVELGVTELWPLRCQRTVAKAEGSERLARWRRLAEAAHKQSFTGAGIHRCTIHQPARFDDFVRRCSADTIRLLCHSDGQPMLPELRRKLSLVPAGIAAPVLAICGPEGDFTPDELKYATELGFSFVALGRRRLRTETAAVAAVTLALAAVEKLIR